jgi:histidinol-phosphatase
MNLPPVDPDILDFAVDLAEQAGQLAADRFYRADFTVTRKQDRTEVTDADLAVEDLIRTTLRNRFPGDGFYGEETGATAGTSGRRWIVDPIDGTAYFAHRIPVFGLNLAYEDEHGPAIGIRHRPVARQMVYAGRGLGCRIRTGDIEVPPTLRDTPDLSQARVEMVNFTFWPTDLVVALHRATHASGYVFGIAALLSGLTDAILIAGDEMGYEDLAPFPVIFAEAGARATDLHGDPLLSGPRTALLSTGRFHDELLALTAKALHQPGEPPHVINPAPVD